MQRSGGLPFVLKRNVGASAGAPRRSADLACPIPSQTGEHGKGSGYNNVWAACSHEIPEPKRWGKTGRLAKGSLEGMKKIVLLGALLVSAVSAGHAQESRQDVSVSGFGFVAPDVYGNVVVPMSTTVTAGVLGSYRYLVTPRSGLELNYSFSQNSIKYNAPAVALPNNRVHSKNQEFTAAYVYSRNYKRYNPFLEAGVGGMFFTPILDQSTTQLSTKSNTSVGGLFGGGVAYELSPSFDLRLEYRGFVTKTPSFGITQFQTNRYYVISTPAIGVAYHF